MVCEILKELQQNPQEVVTERVIFFLLFTCVITSLIILCYVTWKTRLDRRKLTHKNIIWLKTIKDILGTIAVGIVVGMFNDSVLFGVMCPALVYIFIVLNLVLYGIITYGLNEIEEFNK